jgi:hypothetical protein
LLRGYGGVVQLMGGIEKETELLNAIDRVGGSCLVAARRTHCPGGRLKVC